MNTLTGRTRLRLKKRFFRTPLLVLEVEEEVHWRYDDWDGRQHVGTELVWRDARPDDRIPTPTPPELVVVENRDAAIRAGFTPHGRHPATPMIRAWWPGRSMMELAGRPLRRVTIMGRVRDVTPEGSLRDILRSRQMVYGSDAVFMELS